MDRDWTEPSELRPGSVSPEDATPETPSWRIVGTDKSARFTFGSRSGMIRYGRCTAFESASELRVFAKFVEQHSDLMLANGHYQDPVNAASVVLLPGDRVRYTTQGIGVPKPKTVTVSLKNVHRQLWITQKPWEPIPIEHRDWLKRKPVSLRTSKPIDRDQRNV